MSTVVIASRWISSSLRVVVVAAAIAASASAVATPLVVTLAAVSDCGRFLRILYGSALPVPLRQPLELLEGIRALGCGGPGA
jgi:hypothetical protein